MTLSHSMTSTFSLPSTAPLKCQVCSSADKKHGDKCGRTFGYSTEEAKQAGVLVSCDDIGVKNARACGKMITNNYFGGRSILCVDYLYGVVGSLSW